MQLNVFRTLWCVTTPWQQTVSELRSVGCCGIEARVPLTPEEQRTLAQRIDASALEYIAIAFSGGGVIPAQDYQFLYDHGAAAIFGPGTVIPAAAKEMLTTLNKRLAEAEK